MQRLGKTLDRQEVFLGLEEYEEIEVRDGILDDLCHGRLAKAQERLAGFCAGGGADTMGHMNRVRLEGILAYEQGDYAAAEERLCRAAGMTMGGEEGLARLHRRDGGAWHMLFSGMEIETLICLAQVRLAAGKRQDARKLLRNLWGYVQKMVTDEEEKARLEPKLAALLGGIYFDAREYEPCARLCEEALEMSREHGLIPCVTPLLGMLSEIYVRKGMADKGRKLACWKETIGQVYACFGLGLEAVNKLYFHSCVGQYYLIGETVRAERKAQGLTQAQLAEGVYRNTESLSRVENGRMPSDRKLRQLFGRLGVRKYRYTGRVVTDEHEILEMYEEIANLQMRKEYDKADWTLERLRKNLDMDIVDNRQLVEGMEVGQKCRKGDITADEAIQETEKLLGLTYHKKGKRVPFGNEALLMNQICNMLVKKGQIDEAIAAQRQIVELYRGSRVQWKYHFRSVYLIIGNMARNMAYRGHEEAEYWTKLHIVDRLQNGKGNAVHLMLSNLIGMNMEDNKELCKMYMRWAYHLTDMFKMNRDRQYFEKYNEEQFHGEIRWY